MVQPYDHTTKQQKGKLVNRILDWLIILFLIVLCISGIFFLRSAVVDQVEDLDHRRSPGKLFIPGQDSLALNFTLGN